MLRPISGSFLGPKTRAATPAMTASSGTPRPNKELQEKPLRAGLAGRGLAKARRLVLTDLKKAALLWPTNKDDLKEEEIAGFWKEEERESVGESDEISIFGGFVGWRF
uniref:Uncharacterized protein n=1 Tax=Opuntia streptacantha TaxID=393608 RepID=A0A7C9D2P8_OPUST